MIRLTKLSGSWYGYEFKVEDEDEIGNIENFVKDGSVVVIVESLDLLPTTDIQIYPEEIIMVEPDEDEQETIK